MSPGFFPAISSAFSRAVHYRDVQLLYEPALYFKAFRSLDILEVDASERRGDILYGLDEPVDVCGVYFDVKGIHTSEYLEQQCLAFHYRLGCRCPFVAQSQNCRAIGDYRHEIAFGGVVIYGIRIVGYRHDRCRHTGSICQRQVFLRICRLSRFYGYFPRRECAMVFKRLSVY